MLINQAVGQFNLPFGRRSEETASTGCELSNGTGLVGCVRFLSVLLSSDDQRREYEFPICIRPCAGYFQGAGCEDLCIVIQQRIEHMDDSISSLDIGRLDSAVVDDQP